MRTYVHAKYVKNVYGESKQKYFTVFCNRAKLPGVGVPSCEVTDINEPGQRFSWIRALPISSVNCSPTRQHLLTSWRSNTLSICFVSTQSYTQSFKWSNLTYHLCHSESSAPFFQKSNSTMVHINDINLLFENTI
jgi:hypothetical protein